MRPANVLIPAVRTTTLAAALLLAGCAFAPPAKPPASPSPEHYTVEALPAGTAKVDGVSQHYSLGGRPVPEWWREYRNDTLNAWVEEGLRNNPSLAATKHTLESAHQLLRAQVGATMLPSLDAQAQSSRQRSLGSPVFGPPTNLYDVYAGQLALSYNFDVFGATRHGIEQTAAQVDQQSYEFDAAKRTLAANIVIAAINAASLEEQVRTTERLSKLANDQASLTERQYRLGAASQDDALSLRQQAASIGTSLPPLRAQAEKARHALAVLLGRTPDQAPGNLMLADLHLPESVPVSVPSDLLRQRPDVLAAEAAVHAASAQVGVATANLFPHISLSASIGTEGFKPSSLFTSAGSVWGAGLALTQPIFHGGELIAKRKAAIASYNAAIADYQQTVLNAFRDVADTLTALNQDAATLQAAQEAAGAAEQSFAHADARYRLGGVSYPSLVLTEQHWQSARLTEIQARAGRLADTAALFQAMGTPQSPTLAENLRH
ncbi:efflux transporter outer membrane subunit [Dyella choica]|uniref:Efflux transporter outer membrane subunit n=1 Tax=Dyella choica TaxID=1927959 RepID=A0A432M379_9GAMM|nr:efflux transporter outer membrane subunit [Dyella choica]RUL73081.1 efflux transporter outer membrane subunit [Dyella choica]